MVSEGTVPGSSLTPGGHQYHRQKGASMMVLASNVRQASLWQASPSVVFAPLDSGVALLDTSNNIYYALDGIGPFLWEHLGQGASLAGLCEAVMASFSVDEEMARTDISEWLDQMTEAGLVTRRDG